jgi:tetratricopeptide (TPR) repeat protein
MGCAYLKLNDSKNAIRCFSQVVTIDESQGEAWANLANSFLQEGRRAEAYATLEQAVKHCDRSWRMWSNLMLIALQNKKFYKFFECIEKVV